MWAHVIFSSRTQLEMMAESNVLFISAVQSATWGEFSILYINFMKIARSLIFKWLRPQGRKGWLPSQYSDNF